MAGEVDVRAVESLPGAGVPAKAQSRRRYLAVPDDTGGAHPATPGPSVEGRADGTIARCSHCPTVPKEVVSGAGSHRVCPLHSSWASKAGWPWVVIVSVPITDTDERERGSYKEAVSSGCQPRVVREPLSHLVGSWVAALGVFGSPPRLDQLS